MKYSNAIIGIVGLIVGAVGGYYYGKKKTTNEYEADIASIKEEYQKKIDEAKKVGRREAIEALDNGPEDGVKQKLSPNGDIDDEWVDVVTENEAIEHTMEDVVFFAKDSVWYNQDKELTYDSKNIFEVPKDLFTYFGSDKADLIYLHNTRTDEWFSIRYNPGSYVSNVLGYDDSSD